MRFWVETKSQKMRVLQSSCSQCSQGTMKQSTLLNRAKRRPGEAHYPHHQLRQTSSSTSGVRAGRTGHIVLKLERIFFVDRSLPKEYIHPFCLIMVLFAELLHSIRYPWLYQISNAIAPVEPNPRLYSEARIILESHP
jgi:hypothetical protein